MSNQLKNECNWKEKKKSLSEFELHTFSKL